MARDFPQDLSSVKNLTSYFVELSVAIVIRAKPRRRQNFQSRSISSEIRYKKQ